MLANDTTNAPGEQRLSSSATLNYMGEHVHKVAVLLRAATNTGSDEREDESWLVGLAFDEAQRLEARYNERAMRSDKEPK
jgi:hypothetical protein